MRRKHIKKQGLKEIFEIENMSERKRKITMLSSEMDNVNNIKNIKKGKGEILLYRRPSKKLDLSCYGPCPMCFLWMSKKMMSRHQASCYAGTGKLNKSELHTRSDILARRIDKLASKQLIDEVFTVMQNDEIGQICRSDGLIISLGNLWMEKNVSHKLKRGRYTSQIMRLVARLLDSIRKETKTNYSMSDYLKPFFFNDVVKATLVTARVAEDCNEDLRRPSNAVKLEYDIKRMISIEIGFSLMEKNTNSQQEAEDFLKTMKVFWGTRVAKLARTLLCERQFNKRNPLPEPSDIKKLNDYLNKELSVIDENGVDLDNYCRIAKLLSAKLLQYNRRRPGEIEGIMMKDYAMRVSGSQNSNNIVELTPFEKKLLEEQEVITSRGKGHRGVPTLIPLVAKAGMEFISRAEVREAVGINKESPYLFANTGGVNGTFRVYDALVDCCKKADLQYPERVTSTNLRKFMATMTQVLDLKPHQMDWVLRHMGHSLDVHKIYYRATSDVIERTQIAKILLLQDADRFSEFSNSSLDDIQLSDLANEEIYDRNEEEDLTELLEVSETLDELEEETENITVKPVKMSKNSACTRQKWSSEEEEEIKQIFHSCLENSKRPTPKQCIKAIRVSRKNGGLICNRKEDVLKKKVFRMIDGLHQHSAE